MNALPEVIAGTLRGPDYRAIMGELHRSSVSVECECELAVTFADCEAFTPARFRTLRQSMLYVHVAVTAEGRTRIMTAVHHDGTDCYTLSEHETYGHALASVLPLLAECIAETVS